MISKLLTWAVCIAGYGGAMVILGHRLHAVAKRMRVRKRQDAVLASIRHQTISDAMDNDEAINWTERAKQRDNAIERGEAA